jgi:hypothetical protein
MLKVGRWIDDCRVGTSHYWENEGIPPMMRDSTHYCSVQLGQCEFWLRPAPRTIAKRAEELAQFPPAGEAFEEYQRFKNIYCNPLRKYQPDTVMDIKMYGKRN